MPIRTARDLMRQHVRAGALWCGAVAVCAVLPCHCWAQADVTPLPNAPQPDASLQERTASIHGTVMDQDGSLLPGARVEISSQDETFIEIADSEGEFHLAGLRAGKYDIRVLDAGFVNIDESVSVADGEMKELPPIELHMAIAHADVTVFATNHEIAAAQVAEEEKQRVFGIIPNFYVVYDSKPAPLSAGQKFDLAWKSTLDPVTFLGVGINAGIEQASGDFSGYGWGAQGYAKRFGANFADGTISTFLGGFILATAFHQDPRYYYQGTGTVWSRTKHAVSSMVICHGDNGKLEFNYSNVLGTFAAAGISNLYYPSTDRHGAGLTLQNAAEGLGIGAFGAVMQEFVVRKLTPHLPSHKTVDAPVAP
jgi:hypothetical protein